VRPVIIGEDEKVFTPAKVCAAVVTRPRAADPASGILKV